VTQQVREPRPSQETRPADSRTNIYVTDSRADAQRVLQALAACGVPFHVDDMLALVGYPPNIKQLGSALAAAKAQQLIAVVGATIVGGRLVRVWRGVPT
jgi:hypothetical protein